MAVLGPQASARTVPGTGPCRHSLNHPLTQLSFAACHCVGCCGGSTEINSTSCLPLTSPCVSLSGGETPWGPRRVPRCRVPHALRAAQERSGLRWQKAGRGCPAPRASLPTEHCRHSSVEWGGPGFPPPRSRSERWAAIPEGERLMQLGRKSVSSISAFL